MAPYQRKAFTFTLNNYTEDEYISLCNTLGNESNYAIIGKEVGQQGTPHLQGYVQFKRSYQFKTVTDRYLPRCHVESAAGDADANYRYCSKDGDFREFGSRPSRKRTRDELAITFSKSMDEGRTGLAGFADSHPGIWYFSGHNMLRNYQCLQRPIDRPNITVYWIYGPPGIGKSRKAHEEAPEAYIKDPRTKWWNGYMMEKEVIIDDFGPGGIDINHLLRWFDRYKCIVESKGSMIPLWAEKFWVTSNFHPQSVFTSSHDVSVPHVQLPALMRRIQLIELLYLIVLNVPGKVSTAT